MEHEKQLAIRLRRQRGDSMAEFVLVLPFIWIILVLTVDFADMLLARQRVLVSIREVAWRHLQLVGTGVGGAKASDEDRLSTAVDQVNREILGTRKLAGQFRRFPVEFGEVNSGAGGSPDLAAGEVGSFLGGLSGAQRYTVEVDYGPVFGTLVPSRNLEASFFVDGNPWTYRELPGGYMGMLGRSLGAIGGLITGAS